MNAKTKKRLAAIGIAMTGAILIAHVGFTVAWYNGSSNLAVYNFDISLANKELTISTDNVNFTDHLTSDDVKDAIPEKYRPVSSAFSEKWINQRAVLPQFTSGYEEPSDYNMTSFNDVAIKNEGVFRKELYLKCTSYAKVALDAQNTFIVADEVANRAIASKIQSKLYQDKTVDEVVTLLNDIEKSLRFSILVLNDDGQEIDSEQYKYQIIDPHKNGTTKLGGLLDNDLDGYYDSYDGKEVIYGEVNNASDTTLVYQSATIDDVGPSNTNSCFEANHKQGVQSLDLEVSKLNGVEIAEEHSLSLDQLEDFTFTLQADVSKKIVLSLYIEGWDRDSVNYTMFSRFLTGVSFKLAGGGNGGN